jgi:c-di-GMP-binding flagellar brake protein YcgR
MAFQEWNRKQAMFEAGEKVEITVLPDNLSFMSKIQFADRQHLLLTCSPDKADCLRAGANVHLIQVAEGNFYQVQSFIVRCDGRSFVVPLMPPQLIQRRRTPRLQCSLPAHYHVIGGKADAATPEGEPAILTDLSLGGARAYFDRVAIPNSVVAIDVQLTDDECISTEAQVLRCTPAGNVKYTDGRDLPYQIALRFTQISRLNQVILQRYLLRFIPKL